MSFAEAAAFAAPTSRPWRPLLEERDAERARDIVASIATAVRDLRPTSASRCLLGPTGRAVFFTYAASAGLADDATASALLESDVVALCRNGCPIGLWHGYAGLRWALTRLATGDGVEAALERIDGVILAALAAKTWPGVFDLSDGVAGIALAYTGLHTPRDPRILRLALGHLETWLNGSAGQGDIGCAHGLPGVVGVVSRIVDAGVESERGRRMLARAVPLMLAIHAGRDGNASWCRGDAGLAVTLLAAARAAGKPAWEVTAIELARRAALYARDHEPVDACICHGVAGLGHVLNRLQQATGDEELRAAAVHFLRRTIEKRRPGEGAAGYAMLQPRQGAICWVPDISMMVGAAGVGLVLLAASTAHSPTWDSLLLADVD